MNNLVSTRLYTIIILILAATVALALGAAIAGSDYRQIAIVVTIIAGLILLLINTELIWLLVFGSYFLSANLNFLPVPIAPYELLAIVAVTRFIFAHLIFGKRALHLGPRPDWILLGGFFFVLFAHAAIDRFGMRAFGSSIWGGGDLI